MNYLFINPDFIQVYAGLLVKRMIHVQAINRQKRSVAADEDGSSSFAGSSFLSMLSFAGEKKGPTAVEEFLPVVKAVERYFKNDVTVRNYSLP